MPSSPDRHERAPRGEARGRGPERGRGSATFSLREGFLGLQPPAIPPVLFPVDSPFLRTRPRHPGNDARGVERSAIRDIQLGKKLYVGNLPFSATEDEVRATFERHGAVDSVSIITDRETGRPRGFGFVEMSEESAASDAIRALDGSDLGGRSIRVNEAKERERGGGYGRRPRY